MTSYTVRAVRWARGWELHVDGVGVTQVRTLDRVVEQARDLIETMTDTPSADAQILLEVPALEPYRARIDLARREAADASQRAQAAAEEMRAVVEELRGTEHLSVSDVATVLGVSRARVSQLAR